MVACRPPSGTTVPPRLATPRPQPRRPHSSVPPRWQPRTDGDPHAAQQRADQARATRFAQTDPNAASEQSSQPPLSRCCDDHLNPGSFQAVFCLGTLTGTAQQISRLRLRRHCTTTILCCEGHPTGAQAALSHLGKPPSQSRALVSPCEVISFKDNGPGGRPSRPCLSPE